MMFEQHVLVFPQWKDLSVYHEILGCLMCTLRASDEEVSLKWPGPCLQAAEDSRPPQSGPKLEGSVSLSITRISQWAGSSILAESK